MIKGYYGDIKPQTFQQQPMISLTVPLIAPTGCQKSRDVIAMSTGFLPSNVNRSTSEEQKGKAWSIRINKKALALSMIELLKDSTESQCQGTNKIIIHLELSKLL